MTPSFEEMVERRETGKFYPVKTKVSLTEKPDFDFAEEPAFGKLRQYRHIITLSHEFRANDAQLERATANSKRLLANHLYSGVIDALDVIAQAAFAEDHEAVLITASKLRNQLRTTFDEE